MHRHKQAHPLSHDLALQCMVMCKPNYRSVGNPKSMIISSFYHFGCTLSSVMVCSLSHCSPMAMIWSDLRDGQEGLGYDAFSFTHTVANRDEVTSHR